MVDSGENTRLYVVEVNDGLGEGGDEEKEVTRLDFFVTTDSFRAFAIITA